MYLLTPQERAATKEKAIQVLEAFIYAVIAGVVSAVLDYAADTLGHHEPVDLQHLWEVARAAGVAAGVLYFKTKHRDPDAHSDRYTDEQVVKSSRSEQ
jgi:hypothetical protein